MIKDICDLHLYSKCHFDKIKKNIDKYEEKFHHLRNLDDEIKKAKKEIEKAMEIFITPEMKILDLFESKLDKLFTEILEFATNKLSPKVNDLMLYKELQILKKFNRTRKISVNMCSGNQQDDEQLILDVWNNHIIPKLNEKGEALEEDMSKDNYYNKMVYEIKFKVNDEIKFIIHNISKDDSIVSLKFTQLTKKIICFLFNINFKDDEFFDAEY